jgi:hypothetical protein
MQIFLKQRVVIYIRLADTVVHKYFMDIVGHWLIVFRTLKPSVQLHTYASFTVSSPDGSVHAANRIPRILSRDRA